jgi:hypothetical protein
LSPVSGKTDPTGAVYVLDRFVGGRAVLPKPYTNAERPDTDMFYAHGVYDHYPIQKKAYEDRRKKEEHKVAKVRTWARAALAAVDSGQIPPPTDRPALVEVLREIYRAGSKGITRPEVCRVLDRDGGKVSGVMTDLHAAGIIFPLEGKRR